MSEESKRGTFTDEPYENADSIGSWEDRDTNQGQGSLMAQTLCASKGCNLDEKDSNDTLKESKCDSGSENDSRSDTPHCILCFLFFVFCVHCTQIHALFK